MSWDGRPNIGQAASFCWGFLPERKLPSATKYHTQDINMTMPRSNCSRPFQRHHTHDVQGCFPTERKVDMPKKDNLWTRAASNASVTKSLLFSQLNSEHFASWTLDLTQCDNCYIEQALHRLVSCTIPRQTRCLPHFHLPFRPGKSEQSCPGGNLVCTILTSWERVITIPFPPGHFAIYK